MKNYIIKLGLLICNFIAYIFLKCYFFITNKESSLNGEKINAVILADYLNTAMLIDAIQAEEMNAWLVSTKRYNFYNLVLNSRFKKLKGIKFIPDYQDCRTEELLKFCNERKITQVLLQSGDFLVPMLNKLNRLLGSKGNSDLAVQCSLDKHIMRETLNKHNVSKVNLVSVDNENDLEKIDFYPVVLKPSVGTASEGIVCVENASSAKKAFQECQTKMRKTEFKTSFIAEEYVQGRQFDVEGIIHNGQVHVLCVVEENYDGFFPNFDMNWYLFNAIISDELNEKITKTVSQAFGVCEILHGSFHCELRVNSLGEIKILEFANRMGGGFERFISEVTGTNFCELYLSSMLDKPFVIKNKQLMLFDKYFKNATELNQWQSYLNANNIEFTESSIVQDNNKYKLSVRTFEREEIYNISEKFGLSIERVV